MQNCRVDARVSVGRKFSRSFYLPAFGPGAVRVIHIPVPNIRENKSLRSLKPERIDVYHRHEQSGKTLSASRDAEISALLNHVLHITASIRKTDDLRFCMLRLDEKGREVLRIEGMPHRADHPATVGQHNCGGIALKGMAKG